VDLAVIVAIDFIYAIATLALISLGLAIVFGMMRIINLAHGLHGQLQRRRRRASRG
jgi:branched-subunit amino acid ABC-type transport system permease component